MKLLFEYLTPSSLANLSITKSPPPTYFLEEEISDQRLYLIHTNSKLEKFRKVQAHVKAGKAKFDQLKVDVLQKVDLLAAARCNMFSNALIMYQVSQKGYQSVVKGVLYYVSSLHSFPVCHSLCYVLGTMKLIR